METVCEKRVSLNSTSLKFIALIIMATDHIGMVFFPSQLWLRAIGRAAMPLFAFCVAEGFTYTHSRAKYFLRLVIFAAVSELPFDLAVSGGADWGWQNVMFTFALAVAGLCCFEHLRGKGKKSCKIAAWAVVAVFAAAAELFGTDYGFAGVLIVVLFYVLRAKAQIWRVVIPLVCFSAVSGTFFEFWCLMSGVPLMLYNGEKGAGLKWTFYLFYPLHLLMIYFTVLGLMKI